MMMKRLLRADRGSAAAEMALVTPILLLLLFGSMEIGNYFYNEHVLVKGVRDGARYAARQAFANYTTCTGSPPQTVIDSTKQLVRTGQLSGGTDRLPRWTDAATEFTITISCKTAVGTTGMSGIYSGVTNAGGAAVGAPIITVSASLPYRPLVAPFGIGTGLELNASQQAAVMGI